jgi:Uma2 family endonuclease
VYPELVVYDDQGRVKTVMYQQLSGMLLNELQKQHQQVQELTERLTRLEQVLTAQQTLAALTQ